MMSKTFGFAMLAAAAIHCSAQGLIADDVIDSPNGGVWSSTSDIPTNGTMTPWEGTRIVRLVKIGSEFEGDEIVISDYVHGSATSGAWYHDFEAPAEGWAPGNYECELVDFMTVTRHTAFTIVDFP
jgi:hypothetical protein